MLRKDKWLQSLNCKPLFIFAPEGDQVRHGEAELDIRFTWKISTNKSWFINRDISFGLYWV